MESITLQSNNHEKRIKTLLIIAGLFLSVGIYHLFNASKMLYESVEIVQMHDVDLNLDALSEDLPSLEKHLEKTLELINSGLPLTQRQMERLQALYRLLMEKGGVASVQERIIKLIREIVIASGTTEVSLEHLQEGQNFTDDENTGMVSE